MAICYIVHGAATVRLIQCIIVGRLENIIARNRRGNRPRERLVVMISFGAIVLLILGLMVFTDLGLPPELRDGTPVPAAGGQRGKRVDGVFLATPPATKPAGR